ncbi:MAG TPA: class I SAM-dependent methyltransferase [Acidimicrobiales bacterium]|jgi:SAM-dependent methyltransferase
MSTLDEQAWDKRYGGGELVWGAGPNRFLVEQVSNLQPGTALDVASGEGRNAIWLAEQGWRVVGVDFSSVALEKARRLARERGVAVDWLHSDLTTWVPPNPYDLVVALYLHLPPDARHRVFAQMARSVAVGGTMLVVGHDLSNLTEGYGGPQDPTVLYGLDDVVADLDGILEIEQAERVDRWVESPDGTARAIDVLVRGCRGPTDRVTSASS